MKEEKPIWSADGILLNRDIFIDKIGEYYRYKGDFYKNKERADLERDRYEVDYIMKKMACEFRSDNDYRNSLYKKGDKFYIIYSMQHGSDFEGFFIENDYNKFPFNQAYFDTKESADNCLKKLLKKYGKEKLKLIFGVI
jgi:hypothetical protein